MENNVALQAVHKMGTGETCYSCVGKETGKSCNEDNFNQDR